MQRNFYTKLVYARKWPLVGRFAYYLLKFLGSEIPTSVTIGNNFHLVHGGFGVVIAPKCVIGNNVTVFHGVTIGFADHYRTHAKPPIGRRIVIGDDAVIGAGAKILGTSGGLNISAGTIVGANAVLQQSTREQEVWAGVPARCIGLRTDLEFQ